MRSTSVCLLIAALALAGGCTSNIAAPTAQVTSISLAEQSTQGARVEVTVRLTSDNDVPLPLVECTYTVTLEGVGSFSFTEHPNRAIPARRSDINAGPAEQTITLVAAFAADGDVKGRNCRVQGTIVYEPPGEVRKVLTETYVPLPSVPFSGNAVLQ